jgi:hypothetical protein
MKKYINLFISVWLTGLGVGWLLGLSVSPVLSIIITSITGLTAALITASSGLGEKSRWRVDPLPMAIFVTGIIFGSVLGLVARNQNWFGVDISTETKKWVEAGLNMSEPEIIQRLFDLRYPSLISNTIRMEPQFNPQGAGSGSILFGVSTDTCAGLLGKTGSDLHQELSSSTDEQLQALALIITDALQLQQITEEVLCVGEQ